MPTTIANTSKETVSRLIRAEFDSKEFWDDAKELIQTAKDFGLMELANEMENDLKAA